MKRILILLGVLVVLIAGYLVLTNQNEESFVAPADLNFSSWNKEAVTAVTFSSKDELDLNFVQNGGAWTVNGNEASVTRINQLLDSFSSFEIKEKVSSNPENHSRFELGDKGITLIVTTGDQVLPGIVIGKSAGTNDVYVRTPEGDDVYTLTGLPRHLLNLDESTWREKEIYGDETIELLGVKLQDGFTSWEINNSDSVWRGKQFNVETELDSGKVATWASTIKKMQSIDFVYDPDLEKYSGPSQKSVTLIRGTQACGEVKWDTYPSEEADQIVVVRRYEEGCSFGNSLPDKGFIVSKAAFDNIFEPYQDVLARLTPDQESE